MFDEAKFWTWCNGGVKQNIHVDLYGECGEKKKKHMEDTSNLVDD